MFNFSKEPLEFFGTIGKFRGYYICVKCDNLTKYGTYHANNRCRRLKTQHLHINCDECGAEYGVKPKHLR